MAGNAKQGVDPMKTTAEISDRNLFANIEDVEACLAVALELLHEQRLKIEEDYRKLDHVPLRPGRLARAKQYTRIELLRRRDQWRENRSRVLRDYLKWRLAEANDLLVQLDARLRATTDEAEAERLIAHRGNVEAYKELVLETVVNPEMLIGRDLLETSPEPAPAHAPITSVGGRTNS